MIDLNDHNIYMRAALAEARVAAAAGEVPVGAVIVAGGRIIARSHNLTELLTDVTAHAEIQAITAASNYLGNKYLQKCTLYVTLEPCPMCAGALFWSQMEHVVYGASDAKRGYQKHGGPMHPKTKITSGVMAEECAQLLTDFFASKRN
ncbi:MAG: nucleoside deaminase [Schleiferiaceae bacterium]|jgi:tRNA(adenine34) deaminase|nr:nucleoside deaminase [Schleiferiaceae bacterium]MDG1056080.1 nucleoside deaminase [Schleiferiaceae bacterium]MDG1313095.1 nucleoside deaminase [Schleiferiaceae bacterium]MDG1918273.1 nucleoside deaminase [Schleiferiaceae bacterium]MDG2110865.1 nucleoside deaminase [Schleiferiaceae bacterium]